MAKQKRGKQSPSIIPPDQLPPLNNETITNWHECSMLASLWKRTLIAEALREEHPREAILDKLLGMAYAEIGELAAAAERWEEATRLDPNDASLWRLLAGVYQGQNGSPTAAALRRYSLRSRTTTSSTNWKVCATRSRLRWTISGWPMVSAATMPSARVFSSNVGCGRWRRATSSGEPPLPRCFPDHAWLDRATEQPVALSIRVGPY